MLAIARWFKHVEPTVTVALYLYLRLHLHAAVRERLRLLKGLLKWRLQISMLQIRSLQLFEHDRHVRRLLHFLHTPGRRSVVEDERH